MAKCKVCEQDMLTAKGCTVIHHILEDGEKVEPVKAGEEQWVDPGERCGDCGAKYGYPHHPGCDIERCRLCGMQFIGCDCPYTGEVEILIEGHR